MVDKRLDGFFVMINCAKAENAIVKILMMLKVNHVGVKNCATGPTPNRNAQHAKRQKTSPES